MKPKSEAVDLWDLLFKKIMTQELDFILKNVTEPNQLKQELIGFKSSLIGTQEHELFDYVNGIIDSL